MDEGILDEESVEIDAAVAGVCAEKGGAKCGGKTGL